MMTDRVQPLQGVSDRQGSDYTWSKADPYRTLDGCQEPWQNVPHLVGHRPRHRIAIRVHHGGVRRRLPPARQWPNAAGTTCLVLAPTQFLRRLAALVPAPYVNLVRYHGAFASCSRWRARLPRPPAKEAAEVVELPSQPQSVSRPDLASAQTSAASQTTLRDTCARRRRSLPWAQLFMRVFFIDALTCPRCATSMQVLALISDPQVVRKILLHLGLSADMPPTAPAGHGGLDEPRFDDDLTSGAPARPPPH